PGGPHPLPAAARMAGGEGRRGLNHRHQTVETVSSRATTSFRRLPEWQPGDTQPQTNRPGPTRARPPFVYRTETSPHPDAGEGTPMGPKPSERDPCLAREASNLDRLRAGVRQAVEILGRGPLHHPAKDGLRAQLRDGCLCAEEYYRHLLGTVYRLLFR